MSRASEAPTRSVLWRRAEDRLGPYRSRPPAAFGRSVRSCASSCGSPDPTGRRLSEFEDPAIQPTPTLCGLCSRVHAIAVRSSRVDPDDTSAPEHVHFSHEGRTEEGGRPRRLRPSSTVDVVKVLPEARPSPHDSIYFRITLARSLASARDMSTLLSRHDDPAHLGMRNRRRR